MDRQRPPVALRDVLELAATRRGTRLELVCWQLDIEESRVRPAWHVALRIQLLEPHGVDPLTGQAMFTLSERGHRALRKLSPPRSARPTVPARSRLPMRTPMVRLIPRAR
jgi:hypothetical protein